MYNQDVASIKRYVKQGGADALVEGVVLFTLTTIQAGLSTCKGAMTKVRVDGLNANCLWGKKADGLAYARANADRLYSETYKIIKTYGYDDPEGCTEAILLYMAIPNIGMVKAGFICQQLGFNTACLDTHNLRRLGMSPSSTKISAKASPELIRKKVSAYVLLCIDKGGAKYWWDSWCNFVAGNSANRSLPTGKLVSNFHVECVTLPI